MKAIKKGINQGAYLACGGQKDGDPTLQKGNFIQPTIFTNVTKGMDLFQEEIFGPVLAVSSFTNEKEAIELANATKYGLSANIWSQNISRAKRIADQVQTGMVWINGHFVRDLRQPFGGTKASGVGRQGALRSRDFYTEEKMVCTVY